MFTKKHRALEIKLAENNNEDIIINITESNKKTVTLMKGSEVLKFSVDEWYVRNNVFNSKTVSFMVDKAKDTYRVKNFLERNKLIEETFSSDIQWSFDLTFKKPEPSEEPSEEPEEEMKYTSLVVTLDKKFKVHFNIEENCDKKTISFRIGDDELNLIEVLNWNLQESKKEYVLTFDVKNNEDKYKVNNFHKEYYEYKTYSSEELPSIFRFAYKKKVLDVTTTGDEVRTNSVT